eukprot:722667-Prymnesium_polylepis.1
MLHSLSPRARSPPWSTRPHSMPLPTVLPPISSANELPVAAINHSARGSAPPGGEITAPLPVRSRPLPSRHIKGGHVAPASARVRPSPSKHVMGGLAAGRVSPNEVHARL